MSRFELQLDEATREALTRLARADDRSAAATVRFLVKREAMNRGLWTPAAPTLVARKNAREGP